MSWISLYFTFISSVVNLPWLGVVFSSPKHIKLNHERFKFSDLKISGRQVTKIIYSVITEE